MFKDTRAKHVILFHLPPRYGYESILQHVFRKSLNKWQVREPYTTQLNFLIKVHVSPTSLNDHLCESTITGTQIK